MRLLLVACSLLAAATAAFALAEVDGAAQSGRHLAAFTPAGGKGSWVSGMNTGIIAIHAVLLQDGNIAAWTTGKKGDQLTSTLIDPTGKKGWQTLVPGCGFYACKNAFCGAQVVTPTNEIIIIGGHSKDVQWFRRYTHANRKTVMQKMASPRWYPGACTLPDGDVIAIGGSKASGAAGYGTKLLALNNDLYEIYDPQTNKFGGDKKDMSQQLTKSAPAGTYPISMIAPNGNLVVSSGNTLYAYKRSGPWTVAKAFAYKPRPHAPFSYPQTGQGLLLTLQAPWTDAYFLAAGGTSKDHASKDTPASDAAHIINLMDGPAAKWLSVGPMPYKRVLGDCLTLCDGTVMCLGGAQTGTAGWGKTPRLYNFRDGKKYQCNTQCGFTFDFNYEPVIYDPATKQWSKKGSLSLAMRPRLYHSSALLTADCSVMSSGSDVSGDKTAEFYKPPYLSKGPRPVIKAAPATAKPGQVLDVAYASADPVQKGILIRTGSSTHSMQFDLRSLWLEIDVSTPNVAKVTMPPTYNLTPPGLYMLVLLSNKGVPSKAAIVSIGYPGA